VAGRYSQRGAVCAADLFELKIARGADFDVQRPLADTLGIVKKRTKGEVLIQLPA
jgi:hypothetical protein